MALIDNILAYWKLDNDGSGGVSLVDSTPNGNTFTNNNSVTLGAGKIDGCGQFNNTNWLQTATLPAFGTSNFSVSAWINPSAGQAGFPIIFNTRTTDTPDASGLTFGINGNNLFFYSDTFLLVGQGSIQEDAWSLVTLVRSGDVLTIYINGYSDKSGSVAGYNFSQTGASIAGFQNASTWYWDGRIDEVGVWNRALSQAEVTELYNGGAGKSYPLPSFYFNAAVDGNLATLGNWWRDIGFTTPADALPANSETVFITAPVTSGTATYGNATISANIGSAVSITANAITLNSGINSGTLIGSVFLNNSASNAGTIAGTTTLNGSSFNNGTITGNATFNANTYNGINGSVSGNATFRGTEGNSGTVGGAAEFFDTTENIGTVEGNATFRDSSSNSGGVVEGNATIYNPSANPVAGVVMGTETYLWPNGTGLWGGDVWINGDIAFIIPEPSDVRSGVEYGPASAPYTGTYSGGAAKAISISQLLKLPFPINV